jgi:(p)ppGpp synthase/HD superfamily hydrolase
MTQFDKHKVSIRYWLLGKGYFKAIKAMEFASQFHTGLRKDKITPEFHHQISIAHYLRTLSSIKDEEVVLCCAFLHDVVEDYDVALSEIELLFGKQIREAIALLSKVIGGTKKDLGSYFEQISACPVASIVKGGDRVHNLSTCSDVFTLQKQQIYIEETEKYVLPMLKQARRNFPEQELAYENIKHVLINQVNLIRKVVEANTSRT